MISILFIKVDEDRRGIIARIFMIILVILRSKEELKLKLVL